MQQQVEKLDKKGLKRVFEHIGNCMYGYVSGWYCMFFYSLLSVTLMERGSYEWEEDKMFIPILVLFLLAWLGGVIFFLVKKYKRKKVGYSLFEFVLFFCIALLSIYFFVDKR